MTVPVIVKCNKNFIISKLLDAVRADTRLEVKKFSLTSFPEAKKIVRKAENAFDDSCKNNSNTVEINSSLNQNFKN